MIVEWGTVADDATAAIPQTPDPVPQLQKLTSSTDEVKNQIVTTGKASESKLSEVSTKLTAPLSVKVESLAVLRMENHPGLQTNQSNQSQANSKKHVAYAIGASKPAFFASQREAVSWERMMAPSDSRIASITSNSSEFGGNNVSNNYNVSISIDGVGMNDDQMANTVADKFLSAIRRASYAELDIT